MPGPWAKSRASGSGRDHHRHDHRTPPVRLVHPASDEAAHELLELVGVLGAVGERVGMLRALFEDPVESRVRDASIARAQDSQRQRR